MSRILVGSLEIWLVLAGAAYPALKMAERCQDISTPGISVELLVPLLLLLPVGTALIAIYREWGLPRGQAVSRAVLLAFLGAAFVGLMYQCTV